MKVQPRVSTAAGVAGGLAVFIATVTGLGAQQQPADATCTLTGRIVAAGTPLPGVSLTARRGETIHRATSTGVDGTYQVALGAGEYSLHAELTGFQTVDRTIALLGTPCAQSLDLILTLVPRTAPRAAVPQGAAQGGAPAAAQGAAPAVAGARGGRGGRGGQAAPFQTLAVNADAAGTAVDAGEAVEAPPLLLPPGFNAEASADAIAVTGNAARVDRGLLDDRADAFARGELPPNIADLASAFAANGFPPGGPGGPGGGFAGPGGPAGGPGGGTAGRGGPGGPGRGGPDGGFALAGRGGRGGRRLQASADYTFGGSVLDTAPYQLRGDAPIEQRPYTRQSFGSTFGGPVKIPGLYMNTANRTSFQASYGANRGSNLFDQYATVPTDAMRAGDFSSALAALIDPATGLPFPGNQIPAGRISPAAQSLLARIPPANLPGTTRNLHYVTTTASVSDAINARVNHTFGTAPATGRGGRGGGRGGGGRGGGGAAGRGANLALSTTIALNAQFQYRRNDNDQTNVFSTLGGTTTSTSVSAPVGVNIARGRDIQTVNLQLSRTSSSTSNRFAGIENVAALAGIQGTSTDPLAWGVPALSFSSVSGVRDVTPSRRDDSRIGLNYSWTHPLARHALRLGSSLQIDRGSSQSETNANGSFIFTGIYTSGGTSVARGFDVADFLLGLPQQATVQYGPGLVALHGRSFSAFVQDDWRARGNLTLNLGLRYELLRPFVEEGGQLVNLDVTPDFSAATPVMAGDTGPFTGGFPSALLQTDTNNLAPRIGIAWRTSQGLVVRGGYGVSYNSGAYAGFARQLSSQPPFAVTNTQIGALNNILLMENALLGGQPTDTTNTFGVDKDYALGRVQTWNADLQRNLGRAWTVSANYTHTRGSSLDVVRAPNRDADGLRIDGVQPFLWQSSEGSSVLDSVNLQLQRRQVNGIGWRVSYALARSRDNAPSIGGGTVVAQNDQDIDAEWGLSNFDRRHRLTADVNLELPFGQNRRWLNNGGPWAAMLENWRLNTIFTADAGTPLSARIRGAASDVSRGLNGALRADYTGADLDVEDPTIDQFFNTSAFTVPGAGQFGNSARNLIIGPGSRQLDASLSRDVRLGGNRAVTIQVRATNLLNLVNYTAIDTFVNSPTFGQVTSVRPMRSAQFNLRFRF